MAFLEVFKPRRRRKYNLSIYELIIFYILHILIMLLLFGLLVFSHIYILYIYTNGVGGFGHGLDPGADEGCNPDGLGPVVFGPPPENPKKGQKTPFLTPPKKVGPGSQKWPSRAPSQSYFSLFLGVNQSLIRGGGFGLFGGF